MQVGSGPRVVEIRHFKSKLLLLESQKPCLVF